MRRLNVQFNQIEECIRTSLFAIDGLPKNPPLRKGEELLLQLVKSDAQRLGRLDRRIEFALIFERAVPDPTGVISRRHWPNAGKTWRWILECSDTVPTLPFSLEKLPLSKDYGGEANPRHIDAQDEAVIRSYVKAEAQRELIAKTENIRDLLIAIRNYDTVVRLAPKRTTRVREHERRLQEPWLGDALKMYYDHRCQICLNDFRPRYGVAYADTRFLTPLSDGGEPVSTNTVVLCPNHNAVIGAGKAGFDSPSLSFRFANGLVEKLTMRDHLL